MKVTQNIGMKNVFLSWGGGGVASVIVFILIPFFMKNEIRDYFYGIA